jgi:hypothetical protein
MFPRGPKTILIAIVALTLSIMLAAPGRAATVGLADGHGGRTVLAIAGAITEADPVVIDAVLQLASRAHKPVKMVMISSPGGNFIAGLEIADRIHHLGLPVLVRGECLSACAFVALASRNLRLSGGGKVGVHQAYDPAGSPDFEATRFAARLLRSFGARNSAIAKMLATPPDKMAILSLRDLGASAAGIGR